MTLSRSLDGNCSAGRRYHCPWRAHSRRPHTHASCERWNDANASLEEAVAHVEVDRCIDEKSASSLTNVTYFTEAAPIKYTPRKKPKPGSRKLKILSLLPYAREPLSGYNMICQWPASHQQQAFVLIYIQLAHCTLEYFLRVKHHFQRHTAS